MFPHLYVYPSQRNFQIFQPEKDIKHIKDILYSVYNLDYFLTQIFLTNKYIKNINEYKIDCFENIKLISQFIL
jgi:superfamily I DNA/RNA helicase